MVRTPRLLVTRRQVLRCIFASSNNNGIIDNRTNITEDIKADEVIRYIAHRHHATADDVIKSVIGNRPKVDLEENEINIIRDLMRMYNIKQY